MTPEEETQFMERLTKLFILIPKDRFYHCVGGAVAMFVVALGINIGSVYKAIDSTTAKETTKRIEALEHSAKDEVARIQAIAKDADEYIAALPKDFYVQTDKLYQIRTENKNYELFVSHNSVSNGANVVVAEGRRGRTWEFVPHPKDK
jgi:hypothetical protein